MKYTKFVKRTFKHTKKSVLHPDLSLISFHINDIWYAVRYAISDLFVYIASILYFISFPISHIIFYILYKNTVYRKNKKRGQQKKTI